ncbi:MAG: diguanylate cyclase [Paraglaciecola sp.]|jgi:diguanylate cyclase
MLDKKFEKSFATLKHTIPLLLKHKIPAIPTNYALWYTYADNKTPALTAAINEVVEHNMPLSVAKTEDLYRTHVAQKQDVSVWQLRQSLDAMIIELSQSVQDTRQQTNSFKSIMDSCMDDLAKVKKEGVSVEEVMDLVRTLVQQTKSIRGSTLSFNSALIDAEQEIALLRRQLQQSQHHALYDALTGLCNRRYFDEELASHALRPDVCLILVDLDHFKMINDSHGHVMGDLVLKATAKKLQAMCQDCAQAFRFGGEEFAVLVTESSISEVRQMAETMRKAVERIALRDKSSGEILDGITASFGVAQLQKGMNPLALIELADKHLYDAKNLGRNRVLPLA